MKRLPEKLPLASLRQLLGDMSQYSKLDGAALVNPFTIHHVVWHLIVRMRPFWLVMAGNLRLFGAIYRT